VDISSFDLVTVLSKWAIYLCFTAIVGGSFMLTFVQKRAEERLATLLYIRNSALFGILLVFVNYLGQVGLFAENGWVGMLDSHMHSLLWFSAIGETVNWRTAGFSIAMVASFIALYSSQNIGWLVWAMLLSAGLLLAYSFSILGHTSNLNVLYQGLITLHVLAIGSWIGSLYLLWRYCLTLNLSLLKGLMEKFGQLAMGVVMLVAISGGAVLLQFIDSPQDLLKSNYGVAMSIKLSLVLVILFIAARHKFILVPNLKNKDEKTATQKLRNSIALEMFIAALILASTAILSSFFGPPNLS
jgi:copper resistance protein D